MRTVLVLLSVLLTVPVGAQEARLVLRDAVVPEFPGFVRQDTTGMESRDYEGKTIYLGDVLMPLGEGAVASAGLDFDPYSEMPVVSLELAPASAARFSDLTGERVGLALAIVLDGRVLLAPTINERIPNGRIQISGQFSLDEARSVVATVRAATGAADSRSARFAAVRRGLDRSTPEATVVSFSEANAAADWLTMLRLMHPAVLGDILEETRPELDVRGDSVRVSPGVGPRSEWIAVADVLERELPEGGVDALTDAEVLALSFVSAGASRLAQEPLVPIGSVQAEGGIVHVVTRLREPFDDEMQEDGYVNVWMMSTQQVDGEWVVLVPVNGW
ncbi:hypothetical protein B1759_17055 [Rubrivirga sp. SAORIC476]|uniref:SecDF P1 head subdomain-containing protein n=1 Tax=Rubrivirga sp. SAORIC476 TaxID=1961794 RepID=UPI000BA909AB|nr:hypothetical protein [Rubrivirga sp. SAORIC476]PAP74880.1 hypothetical protein B1759_17055 [Rubrivirga sp. SAORIC476]